MNTTKKNGTVKWYNTQKGYGFLVPEEGGKDVFVHASEINKARLGDVREGDRVVYDLVDSHGRQCAGNLERAV